MLAKSKFSVSFSKQETFGISMMESAFSGCIPIVPDDLSYKELYPHEVKFSMMRKSREAIYDQVAYIIDVYTHNDTYKVIDDIQQGLYKWLIQCDLTQGRLVVGYLGNT